MENLRLQIINTIITLLTPLQTAYPEVIQVINDLSVNKTDSLTNFIKTYYSSIPYNANLQNLVTTLVNQGILPNTYLNEIQVTNTPVVETKPEEVINDNVTSQENTVSEVETPVQTENVTQIETPKEIEKVSNSIPEATTPVSPMEVAEPQVPVEAVNDLPQEENFSSLPKIEETPESNNKTIYRLISSKPLNVKSLDFETIKKNIQEKLKDLAFETIDGIKCYTIDSLPLVKPVEQAIEPEETPEPDIKDNVMEIQPTTVDDNISNEETKENDDLPIEFGATLNDNDSIDSMSKVLEVTPSNGIPIGITSSDNENISSYEPKEEMAPKFEPFEITSLHSMSKLAEGYIEPQGDFEVNNQPVEDYLASKNIEESENYEDAEDVPNPKEVELENKFNQESREMQATINELEEEKRRLEEEKEQLKQFGEENRKKVIELERQRAIDAESDKLEEEKRIKEQQEHAIQLEKRNEILRKEILEAQLSYLDNANKFIKDLETKSEKDIYESLYNLSRIDYIYHCLSNSSFETLNRFLNYLIQKAGNENENVSISIYMIQAIKKILGTRAYQEEERKKIV